MRTWKKALAVVVCVAALVVATVFATLAYLTSQDKVQNTFTVGNVSIILDEAAVDSDGHAVASDPRVKANEYHLLPGHTYDKDPVVTVKANSDDCYIRAFVSVGKSNELDAIFASENMSSYIDDGHLDLSKVVYGLSDDWIIKNISVVGNVRTYEVWYKDGAVFDAVTVDTALDALFDQIFIPGEITPAQLQTVEGLTIDIVAQAIQADSFDDAADAWASFVAE